MKNYCPNCGKLSDKIETTCPYCKRSKSWLSNPLTEDPYKVCTFLKVMAILTIIGGVITGIYCIGSDMALIGIILALSSLIAAAFTFAISNVVYNVAVTSTKSEQIKQYLSVLMDIAIPNIDENISDIVLTIKNDRN